MGLDSSSGEGGQACEAARASTSSSNSGKDAANDPEPNGDLADQDQGEPPQSPMELVSSALDHVDIVIYTVLETLQGKVNGGVA